MSSLFVRLSAAFACTAATACLVIGSIVYQQTSSGLLDRGRTAAAREATFAVNAAAPGGTLPIGAQYAGSSLLPERLVETMRAHAEAPGLVETLITGTGANERVWAAANGTAATPAVYVSDSLSGQERELARLRSTLWLGALAATILATAVGVLLAAWLTRRLRHTARTAREIASGSLRQRVRLGGRDEVAALAGAIDDMADALEARINRERQFAADAAHELRTPLAGTFAASQMLPRGRSIVLVRDGLARMRRLVEQLLELARVDGGLDAMQVDVVDLQTVAWSAQRIYPDIVVDAPLSSIVTTDLRRLERIVANLVENALRHGAPPVTIHVDDHRIAVTDHGPGFDPDFIPNATERFRVGDAARANGVGLGLAITAEHARALQADLRIENQPDGGGSVSIALRDLGQPLAGGVA